MKIRCHEALCLTLALLWGGCTPARNPIRAPEPRPLGHDLSSPETLAGGQIPEFAEPTGDITLRDALNAAIRNNPQLAAFSWESRAREAEVLQAGLRVNPELATTIENVAGSGGYPGFQGSETTVTLSQLVELGGKRGKRLALASYEQNLALWDYEAARIDVLTETAKSFLEVVAAQEKLALAAELVSIAEEALAAVARRVQAGATSPVEERRARVEMEISRIADTTAERSLAAARTRLSATWGSAEPRFVHALGDLEFVPPPPLLDDLQRLVEQNPALARWATELDSRRATVELERSRRTPNLVLGAGVRSFGRFDDAALVFEFGLPIPIFDHNQGALRAAEMRVRRGEAEERASSVRAHSALAITHQGLLAADSEAQALRERALPEAQGAFSAAQEAYLRGAMRFTDVLDTKRLLFELKGRYLDALLSYHSAVADLERLTGEPIAAAREDSGRPQQ